MFFEVLAAKFKLLRANISHSFFTSLILVSTVFFLAIKWLAIWHVAMMKEDTMAGVHTSWA